MQTETRKIAFFHSGRRVERKGDVGVSLPSNMYWGIYELARDGQDLIEYSPTEIKGFLGTWVNWFFSGSARRERAKIYREADAIFLVAKPTLLLVLMDILIAQHRPKRVYWIWAGNPLPFQLSGLRRAFDLAMLKIANRVTQGVLPLTTYESENLKTSHGLQKTMRCPFGIDVQFYAPEPRERELDVIVIGDNRNRDWRFAARLAERLTDLHFTFVSKKHNFAQYGSLENVDIRRHETLMSTRELLLRSRCLLVPTRLNYHFSGMTTVLMALACGRTTLIDDALHLDDFQFVPDQNIVTFERGDIDGAAEKLRHILGDDFPRDAFEDAAWQCGLKNSTHNAADQLRKMIGL